MSAHCLKCFCIAGLAFSLAACEGMADKDSGPPPGYSALSATGTSDFPVGFDADGDGMADTPNTSPLKGFITNNLSGSVRFVSDSVSSGDTSGRLAYNIVAGDGRWDHLTGTAPVSILAETGASNSEHQTLMISDANIVYRRVARSDYGIKIDSAEPDEDPMLDTDPIANGYEYVDVYKIDRDGGTSDSNRFTGILGIPTAAIDIPNIGSVDYTGAAYGTLVSSINSGSRSSIFVLGDSTLTANFGDAIPTIDVVISAIKYVSESVSNDGSINNSSQLTSVTVTGMTVSGNSFSGGTIRATGTSFGGNDGYSFADTDYRFAEGYFYGAPTDHDSDSGTESVPAEVGGIIAAGTTYTSTDTAEGFHLTFFAKDPVASTD